MIVALSDSVPTYNLRASSDWNISKFPKEPKPNYVTDGRNYVTDGSYPLISGLHRPKNLKT